MKIIRDKDLGIDCDHVSEGETKDEVVKKAIEHIQLEHSDDYDRVKGMLKMNVREKEKGLEDSDEELDDMYE